MGNQRVQRPAQRPKPTLTDVAQRAGVSVTTASYILNGRGAEMRITPETQSRVREAMTVLGYRPNRVARNLRSRRTRTVGLVSDTVASGSYASALLDGASRTARELDHLLVIGETSGDPEVERLLIEDLQDRQVDGIVFASLVTRRVTLPASLDPGATVLVNCLDDAGAVPSVVPDEEAGGRLAAQVLLDAGATQGIWTVGGHTQPSAIAGPLRDLGVLSRLAEAGTGVARAIECDWDVPPARSAVAAALAEDRPRALVCKNDRIAFGACQALWDAGLRVPHDVSVVSFDGSELAGWLRPTLTSIRIPYAEMGSTAVRALLDPETTIEGVIRVPMSLLRGGSVGRHRPS